MNNEQNTMPEQFGPYVNALRTIYVQEVSFLEDHECNTEEQQRILKLMNERCNGFVAQGAFITCHATPGFGDIQDMPIVVTMQEYAGDSYSFELRQ